MRLPAVLLTVVFACRGATEADLRNAFAARTGTVHLPEGLIEITREIAIAPDAHDLTVFGPKTTIKAAAAFRGRALITITASHNIHIEGLTLDGNRDEIGRITPPVSSSAMMSRATANHGILAENAVNLEIANVKLQQVAGFAVLIDAGNGIRLHDLDINQSGGFDPERHNSGMGGILIEEGVDNFDITRCLFGRIRGSGITVRSLKTSALNQQGAIAENELAAVSRDAVRIAGASNLRIENNRGRLIGYPVEETDVQGNILPSVFHTVERADKIIFRANTFDNIDGRCFTLSGLTGSSVSGNVCSEQLFGAMLLEGSGNTVESNRFLKMNLARKDTPETLTAGIYLGAAAANNRVITNELSGFGMSRHCVVAATQSNQIAKNDCLDEPSVARRQHAPPRSPSFAAAAFPSRR